MTLDKLRAIIGDVDAAYRGASDTLDGMIERGAHAVQISRQRERRDRFASALATLRAELIISTSDHLTRQN